MGRVQLKKKVGWQFFSFRNQMRNLLAAQQQQQQQLLLLLLQAFAPKNLKNVENRRRESYAIAVTTKKGFVCLYIPHTTKKGLDHSVDTQ